MVRYLRLTILFAAVILSPIAASEPLKSVLEAFLVVTEMKDGKEVEKLVAVEEAQPEATIEYVLTYTNVSTEALNGFAIKTPVPKNTRYQAGSASASVRSTFNVSVDEGASFEKEPVTRMIIENGKSKEIVIPPTEYDALAWDVSKKLKPKKSMVMRYRVTIN